VEVDDIDFEFDNLMNPTELHRNQIGGGSGGGGYEDDPSRS
jgi:hypothetical protein